jgi:hypothetical protein
MGLRPHANQAKHEHSLVSAQLSRNDFRKILTDLPTGDEGASWLVRQSSGSRKFMPIDSARIHANSSLAEHGLA